MTKYKIVPPLRGAVLTIQTDRLYLSVCKPSWAKSVVEYLSKNRAYHKPFQQTHTDSYFTVGEQREYLKYDLKEYNRNLQVPFWITKKDEPYKVVGRVSFYGVIYGCMNTCYVGYHLDEEKLGHGYMTEALEAGIKFVFRYFRIHRIEADILPNNERSLSVVKRCGFEEMGYNKKYMAIDGRYQDHVMYVRLNADEEKVT